MSENQQVRGREGGREGECNAVIEPYLLSLPGKDFTERGREGGKEGRREERREELWDVLMWRLLQVVDLQARLRLLTLSNEVRPSLPPSLPPSFPFPIPPPLFPHSLLLLSLPPPLPPLPTLSLFTRPLASARKHGERFK